VAALNSSVADPANITRAERELGSSSTFLNIGERASAQAAARPASTKNEDDPAKEDTTAADAAASISARNSAAAQLRAATATVISAQLVSGIERTSAQLMGSLSQLENRLRSLEEHEQELSSRSRAAVASLVKEGNMAAASLDNIANGARASAAAPLSATHSLAPALRSTAAAKPSLASHPYALLPSSTINRLHSTASQLASGGISTEAIATSDPEACARQAMISNRDLARRTLVTQGFDAASGLLADAAIAAASSKMPKARASFDDEDDDDAFQAALSRARERVQHPSQAVLGPDSSAPPGVLGVVDDGLSSFLQGIASRFAETDATIARNKSILRA